MNGKNGHELVRYSNNHIWGVLITTKYADLKKWQWVGKHSDLIILLKKNLQCNKKSALLLYNLSINVYKKIKKIARAIFRQNSGPRISIFYLF